MLVFAEYDEALLAQRMKRIADGDFARQNSGIMNCLPIAVATAQRPSIACSAQPNSMDSIPKHICLMCSLGLQIIP